MRKLIFKLLLVISMISLIPFNAFASQTSRTDSLTQKEINKLLEQKNINIIKDEDCISPENFERISAELEKNPMDKRTEKDIYDIFDKLKIKKVKLYSENELNTNASPTPYSLAVGSVGFMNYYRTSSAFVATGKLQNLNVFDTIQQIAGYHQGFSMFPGSSTYVPQFSYYFSKLNIPPGITALETRSVTHYGGKAKQRIDAVVYDGGSSLPVYSQIVSNENGVFSSY